MWLDCWSCDVCAVPPLAPPDPGTAACSFARHVLRAIYSSPTVSVSIFWHVQEVLSLTAFGIIRFFRLESSITVAGSTPTRQRHTKSRTSPLTMAFILTKSEESHSSWAYFMTNTPLLRLRCHEAIEQLPLLLTHAFNSSKPEYMEARAKYLQIPLLRLVMPGQSEERARSAVMQHFLPMWVESPSTSDSLSTTPYCLTDSELPAAEDRLQCLHPTLLRPCGDFDRDGVRLSGVLVVRVAALPTSAVHHSGQHESGLQLDISCPSSEWLTSRQWQYNKAMGSQQADGLHTSLSAALLAAQGSSIPQLQQGMIVWLLNVKELPTSPPARDGKKIMQRVGVTLPAPASLRRLGHAVAQAASVPLAVKASTKGDDWTEQLAQYTPGAVAPPLNTLQVYAPAKAARNINMLSSGAVPASLLKTPPSQTPPPDTPAAGSQSATSPRAFSQGLSGGAAASAPAEPSCSARQRRSAVEAPQPGLPQTAPLLKAPRLPHSLAQGGVQLAVQVPHATTHVFCAISASQRVEVLSSGELAPEHSWNRAQMHAVTYSSDGTDNPAPAHGGAGGVKRPRSNSSSSLEGSLLGTGGGLPWGADSVVGDAAERDMYALQPASKSPRGGHGLDSGEARDFARLFAWQGMGGGAKDPPSATLGGGSGADGDMAWLDDDMCTSAAAPPHGWGVQGGSAHSS